VDQAVDEDAVPVPLQALVGVAADEMEAVA
jgi:hypothetical protein